MSGSVCKETCREFFSIILVDVSSYFQPSGSAPEILENVKATIKFVVNELGHHHYQQIDNKH
jgi:hypothetical protein